MSSVKQLVDNKLSNKEILENLGIKPTISNVQILSAILRDNNLERKVWNKKNPLESFDKEIQALHKQGKTPAEICIALGAGARNERQVRNYLLKFKSPDEKWIERYEKMKSFMDWSDLYVSEICGYKTVDSLKRAIKASKKFPLMGMIVLFETMQQKK